VTRRGDGGGAVVAAFDLDGTLATGHSMADFAMRVAGRSAAVVAAVLGVAGAGFPPSRSAYKQAVLGRVLGGRTEDDVRRAAQVFAEELVADRLIEDAVAQLDAHRAVGHDVVLVTAALDVYAAVVGELLGAAAVLATEVEVVDGVCTGGLIDADLHDERKVERLRAWLGDREPDVTVFAYGNSEDDDELLQYAARTQGRFGSTAATDRTDPSEPSEPEPSSDGVGLERDAAS